MSTRDTASLARRVAVLCFLLLLTPIPEAEADSPGRLTSRPYVFETPDGEEITAEWENLKVPESRSDPAASVVELAFVRLPSVSKLPGSPVVYLAGGPGSSGITSARGLRWPFIAALRQAGDVILLDQRGTGQSRPGLVCQDSWSHPLDEPLDPAEALALIGAKARACAAALAKQGADLSSYNVREIVDDLEDLRVALGAPRLRLVATSYGTHVALQAIRRHEATIERAVLLGVVGPDQTLKLPGRIEQRLRAIEGSGGRSLAEEVGEVLARLAEAPVALAVPDPLSGKDVEIRVGKFDLQLATIRLLGDSRSLTRLRGAYARMMEGDFSPLAQDLLQARKGWIGRAMPYAVLCSSGVSRTRWQRVEEQSAGASLGRWLDFPFPEICADLEVDKLGPEVRTPLQSRVPVLAVSGSLDVRTPVENAEEVLAGLPYSRHVVVEGAGHGDDLMVASPEIAEQVVEFLEAREPPPARQESVPATKMTAIPLWERPTVTPRSTPQDVEQTLHGVRLTDPYRWLEHADTPETRLWVYAQNRYTDSVLGVLPDRTKLRREIDTLLDRHAVGRPWVRNGRSFYTRRRPGEDLAAIVMAEDDTSPGEDAVLIDPRALSTDSSRSVRVLDVSRDGRLLVYGVRQGGMDEIEVRIFDVGARRDLGDVLPRARYFGAALLPGNQGLYYAREGGDGGRLLFHRLGTDPATDREVFGAGYGRGTLVWGNLSDDGRYLVIHAVSNTNRRIDLYVQNVAEGGEIRKAVEGVDATFYGGVMGGRLVIHTTWEAPRGRIFTADPEAPDLAGWREAVPENDKAVLRTVYGAAGRLFVEYVEDVRSRLVTFDLEGRKLEEVPIPAVASLGGIRGHWDQDEVYLTFTSFHLPPTVYRYDAAAEKLEVWERAGSPVDGGSFEVRQVWYPSKDGTRVPMTVIHPRGLELDGSHPTLLTGYGGFGTSLTPSFNEETAVWVGRGGVYAIAHVRGGGELGEQWHQAAVREKKQISFDDFVAAAEWLIEKGYTRSEKLAISGHSNGGLLVGATMTQRPELFRAAVCSHPVLDMLRFDKSEAGRFWIAEYGSPGRPDAFETLYAYSPYHRLEPGRNYPAVFFLTAADDTRVAPFHARKMTARMQNLAVPGQKNNARPVLLRHHRQAGHSGVGVTTSLRSEELTDTLSFLFWQLGEL